MTTPLSMSGSIATAGESNSTPSVDSIGSPSQQQHPQQVSRTHSQTGIGSTIIQECNSFLPVSPSSPASLVSSPSPPRLSVLSSLSAIPESVPLTLAPVTSSVTPPGGNEEHAIEMQPLDMNGRDSPNQQQPQQTTSPMSYTPSSHAAAHSQSRASALSPSRSTLASVMNTPARSASVYVPYYTTTPPMSVLKTKRGSGMLNHEQYATMPNPNRQSSAPMTPQRQLQTTLSPSVLITRPSGSAPLHESKSAQSSPMGMNTTRSTLQHLSLPPTPATVGRRRPSVSLLAENEATVAAISHPVMPLPIEPPGMRPDAMISYSRKDIHFVKHLYQHFENAGRNIWIDFRNIPKAVDFMESIKAGIRESNSFIYVISPDSIGSKYCDAELEYALQFGKRIIPIVIKEVRPDKVRSEIQSINWIFCLPPTPAAPGAATSSSVTLHDVFPYILESVLIDPSYVLMHTKLLVRAMEWEESGEDPSFLATGRELEEANKWMEKSKVYANQQGNNVGMNPANKQRTSIMNRQVRSSVTAPAPLPTRIQKLFIFASNERVAESRRKERLLQKFLEDDNEDDEEESGQVDEDQLGDDLNRSNGSIHADGSTPAKISLNHSSPPHPSSISMNAATPATTRSPERGSIISRQTTPYTSPNGSINPVTTNGGVSLPSSRQTSHSVPGNTSRKAVAPNSNIKRRQAAIHSNHFHQYQSGQNALRLLPHLAANSAYASYHRHKLRRVLSTENELMSGFMQMIQHRELIQKKEQDGSEPPNDSSPPPPSARPESPDVNSASPPPLSPPSPGQPSSFDYVRFKLFTWHESSAFLWFLISLFLIEGLLVFLSLILVVSGFAAPNFGASYNESASNAIRPIRIILAVTLAMFTAELLAFITLIYFGWRRIKKQQAFIWCYLFLITIIIMEFLSWDCEGLEHHVRNILIGTINSVPTHAFSHDACKGNIYLWSLILRGGHLIIRATYSLVMHPLLHSLHNFHIQLSNNRGTISKLKQMVSILNGEIQTAETRTMMKWEKLKNFHPSRRFSVNAAPPPGLGIGATSGNALVPPSAAVLAGVATKKSKVNNQTMPAGSVVSPRRSSMILMSSPTAHRLPIMSPRYSTINPAQLLQENLNTLRTPKRSSHLHTPSVTPTRVGRIRHESSGRISLIQTPPTSDTKPTNDTTTASSNASPSDVALPPPPTCATAASDSAQTQNTPSQGPDAASPSELQSGTPNEPQHHRKQSNRSNDAGGLQFHSDPNGHVIDIDPTQVQTRGHALSIDPSQSSSPDLISAVPISDTSVTIHLRSHSDQQQTNEEKVIDIHPEDDDQDEALDHVNGEDEDEDENSESDSHTTESDSDSDTDEDDESHDDSDDDSSQSSVGPSSSHINGILQVALIVRDYDEAIEFYCHKLGFRVIEDTPLESKRWIRLAPPQSSHRSRGVATTILLSKAINDDQLASIGKQAGGRVFLYFHTSHLESDYHLLSSAGVEFTESPRQEPYGQVAVMKDLYGNRIDLIQSNHHAIQPVLNGLSSQLVAHSLNGRPPTSGGVSSSLTSAAAQLGGPRTSLILVSSSAASAVALPFTRSPTSHDALTTGE